MSLPLTRRIAKTVLLAAAGAASVVGTAGAAGAAELPSTPDVGGLSNMDGAHMNKSVEHTSRTAGDMAARSGTSALKGSIPAADKTIRSSSHKTAPDAGALTHGTHGRTQDAVTGTTSSLGKGLPATQTRGLPTDSLPTTALPTKKLPLKVLPLR